MEVLWNYDWKFVSQVVRELSWAKISFLKNHFFNAQLDEFAEGCRGINKMEIMKTGTRSMDTTQLLNQRAIHVSQSHFFIPHFLENPVWLIYYFFQLGTTERNPLSSFFSFSGVLTGDHSFKFLIYSHNTACNWYC